MHHNSATYQWTSRRTCFSVADVDGVFQTVLFPGLDLTIEICTVWMEWEKGMSDSITEQFPVYTNQIELVYHQMEWWQQQLIVGKHIPDEDWDVGACLISEILSCGVYSPTLRLSRLRSEPPMSAKSWDGDLTMQFDCGEQFVFLVKKSVYTRMFANISTANFYVMNEAHVWLYTKQMRADNGDNS